MNATPDSTFSSTEQLVADLQRQLVECRAELTECRAERDEALKRETATAEVLQVINSSPGDLAPVFDAMLGKATLLCEAPHGQLATFDGEFFRFVAVRGEPNFAPGQFALGPIRPEIGVTWPRIAAGEPVVHIADVKEDELYRRGMQAPGGSWMLAVGVHC